MTTDERATLVLRMPDRTYIATLPVRGTAAQMARELSISLSREIAAKNEGPPT